MFYIKLDRHMNLVTTVREPIYRGDHMNQKITYLIPLEVGDIDMEAATVYLSYIRADGTADIALLNRLEDKYNETYYQYRLPVTCNLSRYPGQICTWIQIFAGPPRRPIVAKSSECILHILGSKCMDEYISDRNLRLIYEMQRHMEDKIERTGEVLGERIEETNQALEDGLALKADNVVFNKEDNTLQLLSGENPIGDAVVIKLKNDPAHIIGAEINSAGELVVTFEGGTTKNLGVVGGKGGAVYVPHIDAHKILSFTIENEPTNPPEPVDLNPFDEWNPIWNEGADDVDDVSRSDFIWEKIQ